MNGKILIVCAPSGGGKGTVIKEIKKHYGEDMWVSISATSREPRVNETRDVDYFFISPEAFKAKEKEGYFAESNIYGTNKAYGTPKEELDMHLEEGKICVLDIDINGAMQICSKYWNKYCIAAVFLVPESLSELRKRLINRTTETRDQIDKRVETARREYDKMLDGFGLIFDGIILNANGKIGETTAKLIHITDSVCELRTDRNSPRNIQCELREDILLLK